MASARPRSPPGLALALADAQRRVGLLGVDPARRLRSALGLADLPEAGALVETAGGARLRAAMIDPRRTLDRWVAESCPDEDLRARLAADPFYRALADRITGATDAIAAARAVEWLESDPALDDLIVDTAPGMAAIDLLARPDALRALLDGKLVRVLRRLAAPVARGGGRLVEGVARVAGAEPLRAIGGFIALLDDVLARLVDRLMQARKMLRAPGTATLIVAGVTPDGADVALALAAAVRALAITPRLAILNRALPPSLLAAPPASFDPDPAARAFATFVRGRAHTQALVRARLDGEFRHVVEIPDGLDGDAPDRLAALARLGAPLARALDAL